MKRKVDQEPLVGYRMPRWLASILVAVIVITACSPVSAQAPVIENFQKGTLNTPLRDAVTFQAEFGVFAEKNGEKNLHARVQTYSPGTETFDVEAYLAGCYVNFAIANGNSGLFEVFSDPYCVPDNLDVSKAVVTVTGQDGKTLQCTPTYADRGILQKTCFPE